VQPGDAFTGSERGSGGRGAAAVTARLQVRWRELVSDPLNVFLPSSTRSAASCRFSDTRTTCHPPFGHGGEIALNYCMRDAGGFEGNGQTLRILSRLEDFSKSDGANLTRRAFLGILKYPIRYSEAASADLKPSPLQGPSSIALIDRRPASLRNATSTTKQTSCAQWTRAL
jgi:hypothetical protein